MKDFVPPARPDANFRLSGAADLAESDVQQDSGRDRGEPSGCGVWRGPQRAGRINSPAGGTGSRAVGPVLQTIAEFLTINVDTGPIAVGQSVTVTGGAFADLRFRFGVPGGFETAVGALFLLDREHSGTTTGLGPTTAGVLASTSRIESGEWSSSQA